VLRCVRVSQESLGHSVAPCRSVAQLPERTWYLHGSERCFTAGITLFFLEGRMAYSITGVEFSCPVLKIPM
jgi:hypothetical protein